MKNVQVTVDEETLSRVDRVGRPLGLSRSEIVRQALREWLHKQAVEKFEREWIAAIQQTPDAKSRAEEWRDIQAWGEK